MGKLPKAPLVEVIFELHWEYDIRNMDVNSIAEALYENCKGEMPYREQLQLPNMFLPQSIVRDKLNKHYFRKNEGAYPLLQVGPGVLALNTSGKLYTWDEFAKLTSRLISYIPEGSEIETGCKGCSLKYLDFYPFDFEKGNVFNYLSEQLHFNVSDYAVSGMKPVNVDFKTQYMTECGLFNLNFQRGTVRKEKGIVMNSSVSRKYDVLDKSIISDWLEDAHNILSGYFKSITKGPLYESFK